MRTMKNVLATVVLLAFTTAFAQQAPGNCCKNQDGKAQQPNCPVMEQLNLSADQKAKLKDLRKEYALKDSILFSELSKKKDQVKMERLNAMKSLLNKEQFEKFEKLQAEKKECKGPMNHQKKGFKADAMKSAKMLSVEQSAMRQTEKLDKILDLTDIQSSKILKINLKYAEQDSVLFAGIRDKKRAGEVDKEAIRKNIQASKDAKAKEISQILEEFQNAKYQSMLKAKIEKAQKPESSKAPKAPEGKQK